MLIREVLGKILFRLSKGMINANLASLGASGVEEMPESLKKHR